MLEVVTFRPGRRLWTLPGAAGSSAPAVLFWHGSGPCESDVVAPFAARVARRGPTVVVPDWDSTSPDRGRADLLASLQLVAERHPDFVLAGWSLGGAAAAAVALTPGLPTPRAVVGLAGGFLGGQPVSGTHPVDEAAGWPSAVPCLLVHGVDDEVVPVEESRRFAAAVGGAARLVELPGLHAHVVGTAFDSTVGACLPSDDPDALALSEAALDLILQACRLRPPPNV